MIWIISCGPIFILYKNDNCIKIKPVYTCIIGCSLHFEPPSSIYLKQEYIYVFVYCVEILYKYCALQLGIFIFYFWNTMMYFTHKAGNKYYYYY